MLPYRRPIPQQAFDHDRKATRFETISEIPQSGNNTNHISESTATIFRQTRQLNFVKHDKPIQQTQQTTRCWKTPEVPS